MGRETTMFETLAQAGGERAFFFSDETSGLQAILAIDSLALGPAVGGIRTMGYACWQEGLRDAQQLARAMTLKCAIAGLDAGGAKTVVLAPALRDRAAAFRRLGAYIEELSGLYWSAGDVGTSREDLEAVSLSTDFVVTDLAPLAEAAGKVIVSGMRACAETRGARFSGLRIAIQGCGFIGSSLAHALADAEVDLFVSDIAMDRAVAVANETGAGVVRPGEVLAADVDIVAPCAIGGTIDMAAVSAMKAWAICGGANNQISGSETEQALLDRGILYVPDFLASCGAVIAGAAGTTTAQAPGPLLVRTYDTARAILETSRRLALPTGIVAELMALERLEKGAGLHTAA